MSKSVFVVDDDELMVSNITSLLNDVGYDTSGFLNAEDFLNEIAKPEGVVITDLRLKGMSGRWLQERLQSMQNIQIIFISGVAEVEDAVIALKAGAHDFLVKPFRPQLMIDAVAGAFHKLENNKAQTTRLGEGQAAYGLLTRREREIASLMLSGLRNKQIAYHTGRSENTIKVHRSRILRKFGASSILDLSKKLEGVLDPSSGQNPSS